MMGAASGSTTGAVGTACCGAAAGAGAGAAVFLSCALAAKALIERQRIAINTFFIIFVVWLKFDA